MPKEWDVFISHASEDKPTVALPLHDLLRRAGLRAWLDGFELEIGDSLREKVDEGLANSRYGIVILSPSFLAKRWPARELSGLFAREDSGRKIILPVWHNLTKEELAKTSPMIADRLAANTSHGIDAVAASIVKTVVRDSDSPANTAPLPARRLVELLAGAAESPTIAAFLAAHPDVLVSALGISGRPRVERSITLGDAVIDFCVGDYQPTRGQWSWKLVMLHPVPLTGFGVARSVPVSLQSAVDALARARRWVAANPRMATAILPDLSSNFGCVIFAGRRSELSPSEKATLDEFNDLLVGVRVRTYDALLDAAIA